MFARSGTAYHRSRTFLRINDEVETANEGLAGKAWFINATVTQLNLPAWPDANRAISSDWSSRKEYAERGFLTVDKAEGLNVKSRSVTATVVRSAIGKKWGVLVLDSRDPQGVSDAPDKKALMDLAADIMSNVV